MVMPPSDPNLVGVLPQPCWLAVIAYLIQQLDAQSDWSGRAAALLSAFPSSERLTVEAVGAPMNWSRQTLWAG